MLIHTAGQKEIMRLGFDELLEKVARFNPLMRVRFSTSHPKDMSDECTAYNEQIMKISVNIFTCPHRVAAAGYWN